MNYNIELSEQMLQTIVDVLSNAPYRVAAPILAELKKQIDPQVAPPEPQPPKASNGKEAHPQ